MDDVNAASIVDDTFWQVVLSLIFFNILDVLSVELSSITIISNPG